MQYTKVMRVMRTPSSTQMKFYLENDVGNSLEDAEVISPEDQEEDGSRIILNNNKVMDNNKVMVIKVIKHILSSKVTRGIHKDGINNVETSKVSQTLEEAITDLGTHWTLVIML